MKYFIFLLIYSTTLLGAESKLQRLDPHGKSSLEFSKITNLKDFNQCTVCHKEFNGKVVLKAAPAETCTSCHNKSPHSGSPEHIERTFKGEKINCMTCHSPHRSERKAMVKKDCSECHQWP